MSEGLQDKQGSNKKFFKLKQDKREGSKTLGQYRYFQQEKVNGAWTDTNEGNSMSGILKSLTTKQYLYKDEQKENLEATLVGESGTEYVISFGFNTGIAENLLNALSHEPIIGTVEMNCGLPKNGYPTLYINHNGQKTTWKYSKEAGNWDEIPKITTIVDDDGNKIKKGAKARSEFFKKLLAEVQAKLLPLSQTPVKDAVIAKTEGIKTDTSIDNNRNSNDDLPF